jgi:hypothetical protein
MRVNQAVVLGFSQDVHDEALAKKKKNQRQASMDNSTKRVHLIKDARPLRKGIRNAERLRITKARFHAPGGVKSYNILSVTPSTAP